MGFKPYNGWVQQYLLSSGAPSGRKGLARKRYSTSIIGTTLPKGATTNLLPVRLNQMKAMEKKKRAELLSVRRVLQRLDVTVTHHVEILRVFLPGTFDMLPGGPLFTL